MKIGLWGGSADAIDGRVASTMPVPVIIIVTSFAVKTFKGLRLQLSLFILVSIVLYVHLLII